METADGGPALFRLVRFWSRRWARGVAAADDTSSVPHVLTVEAIDTCGAVEPAVGDVARQLGLDHSGASRMVAAAVERGYVERARGTGDARRSVLRLTAAGRELIEASHEWQRERFGELTAAWDAQDRARFAAYLDRLATEVGA
jgi:DNA-binding MarR family transcriptional regulator